MGFVDLNRKVFDNLARFYDGLIFGIFLEDCLEGLLGEVSIEDGSVVLDAGCGTGNFLSSLSGRETLELYGVDVSEKMLEETRKKLQNNVNLKLREVENLEYRDKFDYIFSIDAFHHFYNQEKSMKNFHNSLKKGGKLIIVDLDFGILNQVIQKLDPGSSKMNSKKEFHELFKRTGFDKIEQKKLGTFSIMTSGKKPS